MTLTSLKLACTLTGKRSEPSGTFPDWRLRALCNNADRFPHRTMLLLSVITLALYLAMIFSVSAGYKIATMVLLVAIVTIAFFISVFSN